MKDNLGNELEVGDIVIYASHMWNCKHEVKEGTVTGFTPKGIKVNGSKRGIHHVALKSRGNVQCDSSCITEVEEPRLDPFATPQGR